MEEENSLGVEEDGVDVLVGAGRRLGGGGHLEGPEEAGDEYFQLFDVLLLRLHHSEHEAESDREVSWQAIAKLKQAKAIAVTGIGCIPPPPPLPPPH